MKLYYAPGACSLAAHIVADEADLRLQLEKVDLKSHTTENGQDYYAVNPKGYVPAIQLDDGSMLTENIAVLNYLADKTAHKLYTPAPGTMEHYHLEEWLGFITSELHRSFRRGQAAGEGQDPQAPGLCGARTRRQEIPDGRAHDRGRRLSLRHAHLGQEDEARPWPPRQSGRILRAHVATRLGQARLQGRRPASGGLAPTTSAPSSSSWP